MNYSIVLILLIYLNINKSFTKCMDKAARTEFLGGTAVDLTLQRSTKDPWSPKTSLGSDAGLTKGEMWQGEYQNKAYRVTLGLNKYNQVTVLSNQEMPKGSATRSKKTTGDLELLVVATDKSIDSGTGCSVEASKSVKYLDCTYKTTFWDNYRPCYFVDYKICNQMEGYNEQKFRSDIKSCNTAINFLKGYRTRVNNFPISKISKLSWKDVELTYNYGGFGEASTYEPESNGKAEAIGSQTFNLGKKVTDEELNNFTIHFSHIHSMCKKLKNMGFQFNYETAPYAPKESSGAISQ